ncbi:MAG TPA: TolC family protein [Halothiobacillus sp.]|jgi:outer membrane protein TolC|nr:TolC family protein [Halothiobacillus sp.]HQS29551.1 TolC family protein [Halothiobacillus sp.]
MRAGGLHRIKPPQWGRVAFLALSGLLTGCAAYRPLVLPQQPEFVAITPAQSTQTIQTPPVLSLTTLQALVLHNNPELKAAKFGAVLAAARTRQAGTLPDPTLNLTRDTPLNGVGLISAMNQAISMDLSALISRKDRLNAAKAAQIQQELNYSWLALTTQIKASDLYIQQVANGAQIHVLTGERGELNARLQQSQAALDRGYITQDRVVADVVRAADLARQVDVLQLTATQMRQQMNALMGAAPDTAWQTQGWPKIIEPSAPEQSARLAHLASHRADLLALRAGVLQADAQYRAALLQQFPGLTLGVSHANDTSNVQTAGLSLGLTLPIFGSAQAGAALAQATRAQLNAELQARINQAVSDVASVQSMLAAYRARLTQIEARLPVLEKTAANAQTALNAGYFSAGSYLAVRATLTAEQLNAIQTRQAIIQAQLALRGVLGLMAEPAIP